MTYRGAGRGRLHSASLDDVVTFAQRSSNAYGGAVPGSGLISHSPNERDYIVEVPPPPNTGTDRHRLPCMAKQARRRFWGGQTAERDAGVRGICAARSTCMWLTAQG